MITDCAAQRREDAVLLSLVDGEVRRAWRKEEAAPSRSSRDRGVGRWAAVAGGTFVTAYSELPPTSDRVWCCMSNGEYGGASSVAENARRSAAVCATRDPRRSRSPDFASTEVTVLSPRSRWRAIASLGQLDRRRRRAVVAELAPLAFAVYLPSVWDERPDWSASRLVSELKDKALGSSHRAAAPAGPWSVYEVDVYQIDPLGPPHAGLALSFNRGFFALRAPETTLGLLHGALRFYLDFLDGDRSRLAYMVTPAGRGGRWTVDYDAEDRQLVRRYADVETAWRLAKTLGQDGYLLDVLAAAEDAWPGDDNHERTARLLFLASDLGVASRHVQEVERLSNSLLRDRAYLDERDASFAAPQAMLALQRSAAVRSALGGAGAAVSGAADRALCDFADAYEVRWKTAVGESGAFAANWILQALGASGTVCSADWPLVRQLRDVCWQAVEAKRSITEEACAATGLLAHPCTAQELQRLQRSVDRWAQLQMRWATGGFRYRIGEEQYRTDVTSHAVAATLDLTRRGSYPDCSDGACR